MSYWTLALLFIAIAVLAYNHPETMLQYLPSWLRSNQDAVEDQSRQENSDRKVQITVDDGENLEIETTPKALPTDTQSSVPIFSLDMPDEKLEPARNVASSNDWAAASPKPASLMPPPPRPKPVPNLMPPPARPTPKLPSTPASCPRVPSNGPLPNRGPAPNSQQRVSGGLTANGIIPVPNPRGKVLLSPGHSPMDWAALTKRENLSGVKTLQRVMPSQLKAMTGRKGKPAWSSWQGKVYNIKPYLDFHPGGKDELMKAAGRDGTKLFMDVHPWVNWENMLGSCVVGIMVPERIDGAEEDEGLEALD